VKIVRYTIEYKEMWDSFIDSARNSHFFFKRDYLEYHSNRFKDYSLLIFNKKKLISILPANIDNNILYSHQGLTFGGLILNRDIKTIQILEIFELLYNYLKDNSIVKMVYKTIPYIYHKMPSEEDRYALFRLNAKLIRRDISSTIALSSEFKYSKLRRRVINRAKRESLEIVKSDNYREFWRVLREILRVKYGVSPVHSLEEIEYLASRFRDNIKLYIVKRDYRILAGTIIYENRDIVHTQYLANSIEGKEIGALDLLIDYLITNIYRDKRYFDFGISTENGGRYLNGGLISQKEGFGARGVVHDFYELEIV